jgi:hypothetical protein
MRSALAAVAVLLATTTAARAQAPCVGDCDNDGTVSIAELLTGVNIALDRQQLDRCRGFDTDDSGALQINELVGGVRSAVDGCLAIVPTPTPTPLPTATATPEEFVAEAAHFECLTNWTRVRHFRIANPLGRLDEALAVARGEAPPPYPVGTIIQLVPTEAMVKRGAGFFPEANDWEFFVLRAPATGTEIASRGRAEVVNIGAPCFACHSAAADVDFICESGHGCIELNLPVTVIDALQLGDPRCPPPPQ